MKMKNSNLGLNYKKSKYLANVQEQWVSLWHKPVSILPEVALAFFFFFGAWIHVISGLWDRLDLFPLP